MATPASFDMKAYASESLSLIMKVLLLWFSLVPSHCERLYDPILIHVSPCGDELIDIAFAEPGYTNVRNDDSVEQRRGTNKIEQRDIEIMNQSSHEQVKAVLIVGDHGTFTYGFTKKSLRIGNTGPSTMVKAIAEGRQTIQNLIKLFFDEEMRRSGCFPLRSWARNPPPPTTSTAL